MAWQHDDVGQSRGDTEEETTQVGLMRILLGQKIKKIHAIDLVVTIGR
jgi:hypothetical protein